MQTRTIQDPRFSFLYYFNPDTGFYARTDVLDEKKRETGVQPFQSSWPHLLDIGIMGHCDHAQTGSCVRSGVQCYQSGTTIHEPNMRLDDFRKIILQVKGLVNQVALGGRGDPDCHEHFDSILSVCRENEIIPNFTTSGYRMDATKAAIAKRFCGAVAVSWYKTPFTFSAIKLLTQAGVKTNIHFVLSKSSIDEAIWRLEKDDFATGINAVIFLLHKPVGLGQTDLILEPGSAAVYRFFNLVDQYNGKAKIGFDTCSFPALINYSKNIDLNSSDTCEAGRFSAYVGPDLLMTPCSFDKSQKFGVSLNKCTVLEAWNSKEFEKFRYTFKQRCPDCEQRLLCFGGCPIVPKVVLCNRSTKRQGRDDSHLPK